MNDPTLLPVVIFSIGVFQLEHNRLTYQALVSGNVSANFTCQDLVSGDFSEVDM